MAGKTGSASRRLVPDPPELPGLTVGTFAAMAALWVILSILAETQAADLAAALAWTIAFGVGLTWGPQALEQFNRSIGRATP